MELTDPLRNSRVLHLVSTTVSPALREDVAAGRRPRPEYLELEQRYGIDLLDWSQLPGGVRGRSAWTSIRHAAAALQRVAGYDVVFSDGEHVGIALAMLKRDLRVPHLIIGHHLTTSAKWPFFRLLRAQRRMSRILVHSQHQLEQASGILKPWADRLRFVRYGVDTKFWHPLELDEDRLIVVPGREHRDFRTLVTACETLSGRVFVTHASGHSRRAHSVDPAHWPRNFELGFLDFPALRQLYAQASVIAIPLVPTDFPAGVTAVLEAMAMGKAIVVSAIEGQTELIRDGEDGILVPPRDPQRLREAVDRLLDDPGERARLGAAARRKVTTAHTLEAYVTRLSEHLAELVTPSSSRRVRARLPSGRSRILVVSPVIPAPSYGFGTRVYYLVRHLARHHQVGLVAYGSAADQRHVETLRRLGVQVELVAAERPRVRGKRLAQMASLLSPLPYQLLDMRSEAMQETIDRLQQDGRFDLVQVESSQMGEFDFGRDSMLLLDEHNIEFEVLYRSFRTEPSLLRKGYNWVEFIKFQREERRLWRRFHACVTTSERERVIVRRDAPGIHAAVVPNGVDLEYFKPVPSSIVPGSLIFTGVMNYRPNTDAATYFVKEILPHIRRANPQVSLAIVGAVPPLELIRLAGENVTVTGWVRDVRPFLRSAAVVVVPMRIGSGTRLKVLEALAMGKAIVSTSLGCEGLDVVPGEHLMLADTPRAFADQVLRLLDDAELSEQLGRNGRALAAMAYSWEVVAQQLDRFHASLIGETSPMTPATLQPAADTSEAAAAGVTRGTATRQSFNSLK